MPNTIQFTDRMPQSTGHINGADSSGANLQTMKQRAAAGNSTKRVWVIDHDHKLEPIVVHTGLSDGTYTDGDGAMITEGMQIVTGVGGR